MIIKALLQVSLDGLGPNHETSIFPCGIFQYMKGVNDKPGTPNYDLKRLALESLTKRIYPNFANVDWSNQKDWKKFDVETRKSIIDSLSEDDYNKLIERIENNPDLGKLLHIKIVEK